MNTYKKLATFRQKDIFPNLEEVVCDFEDRPTGKSIVLNDSGEIALVGTTVNHIYTLPGGGIEENEKIEEGIIREAMEEVGYNTVIIDKIGSLDDFRNRDRKHCISYCAVLKAAGDKKKLNLTEDEKKNELHVKWVRPEKALSILEEERNRVREGKINFYNTAFNIMRDYEFLKEYLNHK